MEFKHVMPILITLFVSVCTGVVIKDVLGFWNGFTLALIIQFIVGSIVNKLIKTRAILKLEEENKKLNLFTLLLVFAAVKTILAYSSLSFSKFPDNSPVAFCNSCASLSSNCCFSTSSLA